MQREAEGWEFAKKGLTRDIQSSICWHVYGLMHKTDRNWSEAKQCLHRALKLDAKNNQILRDLQHVQLLLRDYDGLQESARKVLTLRDGQRMYWLGFVVASHLNGNHDFARQVLKTFQSTRILMKVDVESTELQLYEASTWEDEGKYEEALKHLEENEKFILDQQALAEVRGRLHEALGNVAAATEHYRYLINRNPENLEYHAALCRVMFGLKQGDVCTGEQQEKLKAFYDELAVAHPRALQVKRFPLEIFASGEFFEKRLQDYLQPLLRKGTAAAFKTVKNMFQRDDAKANIIESLVERYVERLRSHSSLSGSDDTEEKEPPVVLFWSLYFLAQCRSARGNYAGALELLDQCEKHTPTVIDIYSLRAQVYKRAGDAAKAFEEQEKARSLDLADRFVNTKAAKYALRAGKIEYSTELLGKFTRPGDDCLKYLTEMQCLWYENEAGEAYMRKNELGIALKHFESVEKHFSAYYVDEVDFMTYCAKKSTLRAWVNLVRHGPALREHEFWTRAARNAVTCYMLVHEQRVGNSDAANSDPELAGLSEVERKKVLKKRRKAEFRRRELEDKKATTQKSSSQLDANRYGEKYLNVAEPLEEAVRFVELLEKCAAKDLATHFTSFDLNMRRCKLLLAARALNRAKSLAATDDFGLHFRIVRFVVAVGNIDKLKEAEKPIKPQSSGAKKPSEEAPKMAPGKTYVPDASVRRTLEKMREEMIGRIDLEKFCSDFLERNSKSFAHRLAAARSLFARFPEKAEAAAQLIFDPSTSYQSGSYTHLKQCIDAQSFLYKLKIAPEKIAEFRAQCAKVFPLATFFIEKAAAPVAEVEK